MRSTFLVVLAIGCGSNKEAAPTAAKPHDAAAHDDPPPPEPDEEIATRPRRAMPLPDRGAACAATCEPPVGDDVEEISPGVVAESFCHHLTCVTEHVIIDCCAPIDAQDSRAVVNALGWKDADAAGREQIARAYVELVEHAVISYADHTVAGHAVTALQTTTRGRDVVVELWTQGLRSMRHRYLARERWRFAADGTATYETIEEHVLPDLDPALARQQALEAARRALDAGP